MTKLYDVALSEIIKERLTQLEEKPKPKPKVPARRIIEQFKDAARHQEWHHTTVRRLFLQSTGFIPLTIELE